jgi:transposase
LARYGRAGRREEDLPVRIVGMETGAPSRGQTLQEGEPGGQTRVGRRKVTTRGWDTAACYGALPRRRTAYDEEWKMVKPLIPHRPPAGRPYNDHRTILGGILWVAKTGSSWREMPQEYGKWETAYRRYELWMKQGLWQRILEALGEEALPGAATKGLN